MKVFVATTNKDKFEEIRSICPSNIDIERLHLEVDEIQSIYTNEVAHKKVYMIRKMAEEMELIKKRDYLLVDDSGFGIETLGKTTDGVFFPGALFKYWYSCQPSKNDIVVRYGGSSAQFSTSVALSVNMNITVFTHTMMGNIASEIQSEEGFDTDTFFIPYGYEQPFHQLGNEIKNKISPRAVAFTEAFYHISNLE
jgi:XTP/dITP diphosphohydrolase